MGVRVFGRGRRLRRIFQFAAPFVLGLSMIAEAPGAYAQEPPPTAECPVDPGGLLGEECTEDDTLAGGLGYRWYGLGRQTGLNHSGVQHVIKYRTIGSTGSTAEVKINCYDNPVGEPNFLFENLWALWQSGTAGVDAKYIEVHAIYRCGAGESRTRRRGWQLWWNKTKKIKVGPSLSGTDTHRYRIVHDHTLALTACPSSLPERTWVPMVDDLQLGCVTFGGSAPHMTSVDSGLEMNDNNGTIRVAHTTYDDLEHRTAHSGGQWLDSDINYKTKDYEPVGAHWPSVGPDNQTHACIHGASSTCH